MRAWPATCSISTMATFGVRVLAMVFVGWFLAAQSFSVSSCCCGPACTHQEDPGPCEACATLPKKAGEKSPGLPCVHVGPVRDVESRKLDLPSLGAFPEDVPVSLALTLSNPAADLVPTGLHGETARGGGRRLHLVLSVLLI